MRPILTKFGGMLRIRLGTQMFCQKLGLIEIQDGGCRQLELRKTIAISLLLDRSASNLVGLLQILYRTHCLSKNAYLLHLKIAVAAILY